jgi:hypothetical protein
MFNYEEGSLLMNDNLDIQTDYLNLAIDSLSKFEAYLANPRNSDPAKRAPHFAAINEAKDIIRDLTGSFPSPSVAASDSVIGELNEVIDRYEDSTATNRERLNIVQEFSTLIYYTEKDINDTARSWEQLAANQGASAEIVSAIDDFDFKKMKELMDEALAVQVGMYNLAAEMETRSQQVILAGTADPATIDLFQDKSDEARLIIEATKGDFPVPVRLDLFGNPALDRFGRATPDITSGYIFEMQGRIAKWESRSTTRADKLNIAREFNNYRAEELYSQENRNQTLSNWSKTLETLETP